MSDFRCVDGHVIGVHEQGDSINVNVMLSVTCKDYLVSSETSEVLRGSDTKINHYTYCLGFLVSSEAKELKNCPNCNAKIKSKGSSVKCEYCGSPIERKTNSLILNDKKMLQQY